MHQRSAREVATQLARRPLLLFVVGVALVQALWMLTVPPFRASDEFDHAYRAAAVARGQWWADEAATDGRGTLVRVPADLVAAAQGQCAALPYTGPDNCEGRPADDATVLAGSGAAMYNPVFYWVIGTAARPFEGAASLYAMRIAAGALCLGFLALAAWALRRRRPGGTGWSGVGLVLAISPVFAFSTSVAAPNGLEMSSALALWCLLLALPDLGREDQGRAVVGAALAASVLASLRMLGPLFVALVVVLVVVHHGRGVVPLVRAHARRFAIATAVVVAAVAAAAGWTLAAGLVGGSGPQGGEWRASALVLWPLQTIAAFPFRDQPGPAAVYAVVGGCVVALLVAALRRSAGHRRVALVASCAAALALPLVLTFLTADGRGVMWQGRYGLPLSVGFVVMAGFALDRSGAVLRWRLVAPAGAALAAVWIACFLKVRAQELARAVSADDPSWHPPAPVLCVLVVALAALLLATSVAGVPSGRRRTSPQELEVPA